MTPGGPFPALWVVLCSGHRRTLFSAVVTTVTSTRHSPQGDGFHDVFWNASDGTRPGMTHFRHCGSFRVVDTQEHSFQRWRRPSHLRYINPSTHVPRRVPFGTEHWQLSHSRTTRSTRAKPLTPEVHTHNGGHRSPRKRSIVRRIGLLLHSFFTLVSTSSSTSALIGVADVSDEDPGPLREVEGGGAAPSSSSSSSTPSSLKKNATLTQRRGALPERWNTFDGKM